MSVSKFISEVKGNVNKAKDFVDDSISKLNEANNLLTDVKKLTIDPVQFTEDKILGSLTQPSVSNVFNVAESLTSLVGKSEQNIKNIVKNAESVANAVERGLNNISNINLNINDIGESLSSQINSIVNSSNLDKLTFQISNQLSHGLSSILDNSIKSSSSLVNYVEDSVAALDSDVLSRLDLTRLNDTINNINENISKTQTISDVLKGNVPRGLQNSLENINIPVSTEGLSAGTERPIAPIRPGVPNQPNPLRNKVGNLVKPVKSITEQISALEQKLAKQSIAPQAKSIGTYVFNANRSAYDVVTSAGPSLGNDPTDILIKYTRNLLTTQFPEKLIRQLYEQLYHEYQPDVTGHTILLMVPPDLSGYRIKQPNAYDIEGDVSEIMNIANFIPFAAVDFTLPTYQVNAESIESRSGGVPYATEVVPTNQMSVTYIENSNLDVYNLHSLWIKYIWGVTAGLIKPDSRYISKGSPLFRAIDYVASFYVLKFDLSLTKIMYAGKAVGCFPQSLPNKELIGNRSSNELTTLPFTYYCSGYYEATVIDGNNWIFKEIASFFQ